MFCGQQCRQVSVVSPTLPEALGTVLRYRKQFLMLHVVIHPKMSATISMLPGWVVSRSMFRFGTLACTSRGIVDTFQGVGFTSEDVGEGVSQHLSRDMLLQCSSSVHVQVGTLPLLVCTALRRLSRRRHILNQRHDDIPCIYNAVDRDTVFAVPPGIFPLNNLKQPILLIEGENDIFAP